MAHIISITDFDTPELDVYARLTENQLVNRADPANALFIAESPLVIGRALESGCVPVSFLMEPRHLTSQALPLLERCPEDIPVYTAAPEVLTRLTGFHLTRGMLCAMRRPALPTVEEVCANARRIAVLENVMNPTNIGAIFRCAAALGMDAVLLTAAGSDPLYRRAACGAAAAGDFLLCRGFLFHPQADPQRDQAHQQRRDPNQRYRGLHPAEISNGDIVSVGGQAMVND